MGHISQAANVYANNKAKETQDVEWQEGGSKRRKLDAAVATIGAILSGGSAGQVAAAAISPELNAQIHKLTEDSKTLNLLAHALLSAAEAHLSGANALAGAASGVAGEATAMFLSEVVFNKPAEQLSDDERTIIKVASQLSGAVVGNVAGGNTSSTILGAETAKRAVENNYLNNLEVENLVRELAQAEKEGKDPKAIFEKYQQISEANRQAMIEECGNNPVCYLPHIYQMGTGNEEAYENLSGLRFTSYKNGLSGTLKGEMATFVENENSNSYAALPSSVHYAGVVMDAAAAAGLGGFSLAGKWKDKPYTSSGMDKHSREKLGDSDSKADMVNLGVNNPRYNKDLNEAINNRSSEHYINEQANKRVNTVTVPIDFDGHILNVEINKRGNLVGGHSIANGNVNVISRGKKNAMGVYEAKISAINPTTGETLTKTSTMFPDSWNASRVKYEVNSAYKNRTEFVNKDGRRMWEGKTPSGVEVRGYLEPKTTVYPIMQNGK